jgi:hypothetical protein
MATEGRGYGPLHTLKHVCEAAKASRRQQKQLKRVTRMQQKAAAPAAKR